ncbi:NAD(P)-dependent dehydrogenase (short-subunit alcohol dehydrogenase family) [Achromobacter deleyi]|jgi:NAD(P)-dependent dehydrogenase (short-subunit alcohol dehydrogenase family)|uniref:SDR family oxidoreductase n=1 Tax=Achromobacter TaxID=222 RepID=UPI00285523A3|nr:SDR family NAD(P)-dependent oxidoreductase [Achromobacter deleyi]MDR6602421.1 NAD(P)-dependent dehydrogenase (short-subunit alcohol dehydrogenase family) [Achromobacter deleyi]
MDGALGLLAGKRAVVTGGANPRGIGAAVVDLFLAQGATVAVLDQAYPERAGAGLADGRVDVHCDVSRAESCEAALAQASQALGGVDVLVNNAGIVAATRIWDLAEDEFRRMIDVNLTGTYNVTHAALPALLESTRRPAIVNLGSTAALRGGGLLGGSHYAASKGGVISFTKALARELGPRGVRANCVAPGIIETDMTLGKFGENWEQELKQGIPLQRFGLPADVAQAILFLASDLSSYSTGIVVDVNGGFHIH